MHRKLAVGALGLAALGCAPKPTPPALATLPVVVPLAKAPTPKAAPAPVVALVEPYLVAVETPRLLAEPPTLRGNIMPNLRDVPILPAPPTTQTVPVEPSAPPASKSTPTAPKRGTVLSPAVVKLFEDERARSVDDARRRLAAASARATQTATEAKKQWGFVKDGFVAQKQAENADATAKEAADEQADAQKSLDDAQARQRSARRDVEAALRAVAVSPVPSEGEGPGILHVAQLTLPTTSYQPMPGLFRLSVLGAGTVKISVQNGTLGRRLEPSLGEAGAWLVRCLDPAQLRVGVDARPATLVVRTLPAPEVRSKV